LGFARVAPAAFSREGDRYRLETPAGLVLEGAVGGRRIFDAVWVRGVCVGSWNAMAQVSVGGAPSWLEARTVTAATWDGARGVLAVTAEGGGAGTRFSIVQEICPDATAPRFSARILRCTNKADAALRLERLYFRQYAPYALTSVKEETVPHLWGAPHRAAWVAPAGDRRWGAFTRAADVAIFRYYVDPVAMSTHPDAGFRPGAAFRDLAPGESYLPADNSAWVIAEADTAAAAVDPFIGTAAARTTTSFFPSRL
jgi:hypothetical protein